MPDLLSPRTRRIARRAMAAAAALVLCLPAPGHAVPPTGAEHGAPPQPPAPAAAMARTPCVAGMAGAYPCRNVDLESLIPAADFSMGKLNDIWGWTDPVTGHEHAIVGLERGTAFVDISDPANPVYVGRLPTHTTGSVWRDMKVYKDHAYVVSEAQGHGLQVFDLRQLRNVANPPAVLAETSHYAGFGSAHNIALDEETGFAYAVGSNTCSGGLHMVDLRDPVAPVFAGCFSADGYTHDTQCVVYRGPDAAYQGREVCFNANEDTLTIVDVTDKANPVQLSRTGYPDSRYTHQGWLTEDQTHFLLCDELDETRLGVNTRTHVWQVGSLDAPVYRSFYRAAVKASDHNVFIRGRRAYLASYRAGLRILDLGCLGEGELSEVGYFDVYPADDKANFNGAWGTYPFFDSGLVVVSGIEQGLFVLRPQPSAPAPIADGGSARVACAALPLSLDGRASQACSPAGLAYRWTRGGVEVCPWSTSPTCDVSPALPGTYELEVRCVDRPGCRDGASVAVSVEGPVAVAGDDPGVCAGSLVRLDGSGSTPCGGPTYYRWLEGATEVCGWSPGATCDVAPRASTGYTLEVACGAGRDCPVADTVFVAVDPALVPPSLGNSLLASRAGSDVRLSWASHPLARSYGLFRDTRKGRWGPAPLRGDLPGPSEVLPDVPAPPALYTYRAAAASCAGELGP